MKGSIMINTEVLASINESVLCWLATVNEDGEPNVSPKEMFIAQDNEHILIANIASPNSVKNINANPAVCLSFINIFKQKGFKVKGSAKVIEPAQSSFQSKLLKLRTLGGEQFEIKSIIEIKVTSVVPIVAPSYGLIAGTTEEGQIKGAMDTYGVQSKNV
jgi:predicted pyridoxine 5'-phosphate oxidase superfamily flavin-nucleotide-binding protein